MAITYELVKTVTAQLYDRSLRGIPEDTKAALQRADAVESTSAAERARASQPVGVPTLRAGNAHPRQWLLPWFARSPGTHMDLVAALKVGRKGSAELIVAPEHTAPHVGSGRVPVLATPVVINLLEAAALAAVEHLLPEGHQSLGVQLDVRHFAATPVGMRVEAQAELIAIDGRMLKFRVSARDEREPISEGTHERVVVNVARFDRRMEAKAGRAT
jgi:fluoroacetyl-CoA thioesterase